MTTSPSAYFNEHDRHAAGWLRNLADAGHIPSGHVDERDIRNVSGDDVRGFRECHFFAGIGGWPLALRLAGWPIDRPVWTGSCPCQPYSGAGKGLGDADPRNLWPEFFRLIRECRPDTIFGEQVKSAIGHGWLDGISADMEGEGYAVGSAVLGAHSVGAPHIRQRLFWVAHTDASGYDRGRSRGAGRFKPANRGGAIGMALPASAERRPYDVGESTPRDGSGGRPTETDHAGSRRPGFWSAFDRLPCRDGKSRRVEPGSFPLAHGVPGRVGRLRAYGNAIVPQAAAEFIGAFLETTSLVA